MCLEELHDFNSIGSSPDITKAGLTIITTSIHRELFWKCANEWTRLAFLLRKISDRFFLLLTASMGQINLFHYAVVWASLQRKIKQVLVFRRFSIGRLLFKICLLYTSPSPRD